MAELVAKPHSANVVCVTSSWDAVTFIGVLLLVLGASGMASLVPALRAARVEPMQVLRDE